jgi:heme-degrading monooxygenase HmoA
MKNKPVFTDHSVIVLDSQWESLNHFNTWRLRKHTIRFAKYGKRKSEMLFKMGMYTDVDRWLIANVWDPDFKYGTVKPLPTHE